MVDQVEDENVDKNFCYTLQTALEKSIKMEEAAFRNFLHAIDLVKDRQGKVMLRDAAREELKHKHRIENVLLDGHDKNISELKKELPTMNLGYVFEQKTITPDADARESLAYAIHLEKSEMAFYKAMINGCEGAPMAELFQSLLADETRHLQILEDFYERYFLAEN